MDKIKSFQRNHNDIKPGLYLQEVKRNINIYDLRVTAPNTKAIPIAAIHTIEHLFATWLKCYSGDFSKEVISFCPGGCQTMFYLELFNDNTFDISYVVKMLLNCIEWCEEQNEIPGCSEIECGNYKSHDLKKAKEILIEYKSILETCISACRISKKAL